MISLISSPAVGFEQPFDMLSACHERVGRSLDLLQRLITHVGVRGHDAQSASAASDVLRYFDLAAPHHHEDEERHVFPALLAMNEVPLTAIVRRLQGDHRQMLTHWSQLRLLLLDWASTDLPRVPVSAVQALANEFVDAYRGHIETEEEIVFPRARAVIESRAGVEAMGAEMRSRRQRAAT